jgi:hypothetical protein
MGGNTMSLFYCRINNQAQAVTPKCRNIRTFDRIAARDAGMERIA